MKIWTQITAWLREDGEKSRAHKFLQEESERVKERFAKSVPLGAMAFYAEC